MGLLLQACGSAAPAPRSAARPAAVAERRAAFPEPTARPPGYLESRVVDPTFGFPITRVTGDSGSIAVPPAGRWGADSRHHYSKDQPWNADESLLWIENPTASDGRPAGGGSPSALLLDGQTYRVLGSASFRNWHPLDSRWHPRQPRVRIGITRDPAAGLDSLHWVRIDPGAATVTALRGWRLPFTPKLIGQGEGNVSDDGRFIALSDDATPTRVVVIDMDPPARNGAYATGARRIGPVCTLPPCGLAAGCRIGNISISPSGRYVDVKYAGDDDAHRIFDVDPRTLALTVHRYPEDAPRCGQLGTGRMVGADGWLMSLKHSDMAANPFDGGKDVIVGITRCRKNSRVQGQMLGVLTMQRLEDGKVTALLDPKLGPEADGLHVSCRNLRRPGWAYVSFDNAPSYRGRRFCDEIVAVKLDGSGTVERLAHQHSDRSRYRAQSQAVPSPDGRRVMWSSNWGVACAPCGVGEIARGVRAIGHVKAFVVDTR